MKHDLKIVYSFYLNPGSDWQAILHGQIGDLKRYGLLKEAELHVIVTNPHNVPGVEEAVAQACGCKPVFRMHEENRYEYWALHHAWQLANSHPTAYIGYLHSKGISYNVQKRTKYEVALTRCTFRNWRYFLKRLKDGSLNKIGLFPSSGSGSWIWFNFWWTTAAYLGTLPEPQASEDRYTFESWLSRSTHGDNDDSFSIYSWTRTRFTVEEANREMRRLAKSRLLRVTPLRRLYFFINPLEKKRSPRQ